MTAQVVFLHIKKTSTRAASSDRVRHVVKNEKDKTTDKTRNNRATDGFSQVEGEKNKMLARQNVGI